MSVCGSGYGLLSTELLQRVLLGGGNRIGQLPVEEGMGGIVCVTNAGSLAQVCHHPVGALLLGHPQAMVVLPVHLRPERQGVLQSRRPRGYYLRLHEVPIRLDLLALTQRIHAYRHLDQLLCIPHRSMLLSTHQIPE